MQDKVVRRWGVFTLSVFMFLATLIIGQKGSPYAIFWLAIGYYAFKGRLRYIQSLLKLAIVLTIGGLSAAVLFMGEDSVAHLASGGKTELIFSVLLMLAPKLALLYYCRSQAEASDDLSRPERATEKIGLNPQLAGNRGGSKLPPSMEDAYASVDEPPKPKKTYNEPYSMEAAYADDSVNLVFAKKSVQPDRDESMKNSQAEKRQEPATNARSIIEDSIWERALDEYQGDQRHRGLWSRLFVQHQGVETKIMADYLQYRAEQMHAEKIEGVNDAAT